MTSSAPELAIHSGWQLDDPGAWSGVVAPMVTAIEERWNTRRLPAITARDAAIDRLRARLSRHPVLPRHSTVTAAHRSRALRAQLATSDVDLLVAVAASTDLVASPGTPVLQITDATFDAVAGFYPQFSGLSQESHRQGARVERLAARNTAHYLVASDWARGSLVDEIGVMPQRITVAPFGPAITAPDPMPPREASGGPLELLFVASDWERKNGNTALRIHHALHERTGARLTIVGETPALSPMSGVRTVGRVSPRALSRLYTCADVLLEPSRANASGVVITDALAHGLPVLATDVGGVATLLRPGVGGWLLPPDRIVEDAISILGSLDRADLAALSRSASEDARERLSWSAWADAFDRAVQASLRDDQY
ncbi:glycosyltransferase family 4 protein [Brachybacterium halotolerans subsp. kimchii]|uniref:glycosyltransferase family 4 protein n=1 Tax=Brachybacterium halotolerans TaxID=2795215 RepID=UPI001E613B00|nr:glycosyltransferase family 4 protein [Brachybacterium halotolerans]UEJ81125.1 glycosyltransferase family 4 protein [Brachybacterium halotolerans subsp. kimchii]